MCMFVGAYGDAMNAYTKNNIDSYRSQEVQSGQRPHMGTRSVI